MNGKNILVYADWSGLDSVRLLGILSVRQVRGKEIFFFEYDKEWLKSEQVLFLDPHLGFYSGKQYLAENNTNFGMFLDSSPDKWGRLLMRRREAALAKRDKRAEVILQESDFLLGVFDGHRIGGLRFKLDAEGEFLNNNKEMASPPWTSLRELEYASLQLEKEDAVNDPLYINWLSMLVNPGSSLGGARPKASVLDEHGSLWIAKFPSASDEKDSGAWEMVINKLAAQCGIEVPEARLQKFTGKHNTFLSKRFDRILKNQRIHYASAMTLLGYNDGTDHSDGVSYLDIAGFILQKGASVKEDLEQLWRRMLFNILISNTDDHLRNHGFLLTPIGWRISPAFDMNPDEYGTGLKLNITETNNELDVLLALDVAKYYRIDAERALQILQELKLVVKNWRTVAKSIGISQSEMEQVQRAFRLAEH